ncbi:MAG: M23 family metallopeptidase [Novosphingobium sp.]
MASLLVAAALPSAAASGAEAGAGSTVEAGNKATLPTGEDARPRGPLAPELADFVADFAAGPHISSAWLAGGPGGYHALSLAPGPLHLSSRFGWRSDPLDRGARFHAGVDIPARAGAAVRAVQAGRVVFSGWAGGYGNLVVIDHGDGVRSRYGHLERVLVAAGDPVGTGTEIGAVGSTGRSTGPHLHYEVRVGGTAIDPLRAAMQVPDEPLRDLVWPESNVPLADVAPRWSWRDADEVDVLPVPVIR